MAENPLVLIGRFTKPYGLKGQIKVQWYVDALEDLQAFKRFYIEDKKSAGGYREIVFTEVKEYQKAYVVKVVGVDDRTSIELFVGKPIYVLEEDFPPLPKGEYYVKDILGCEVFFEGNLFGLVENFFEVGHRTFFMIKMMNGKSLAVPYDPRYFLTIDVNLKRIEARHLSELL